MTLQVAIDDFAPGSIVRDIRRTADKLREQGATQLLVQIPAEDFATSINAVITAQSLFVPFEPTMCGLPCAPYEGAIVTVMGKASADQKHPILFDHSGRGIAEIKE